MDSGSEIWDPEKPIPDPGTGVKKAPDADSGSESATLPNNNALVQGLPDGGEGLKEQPGLLLVESRDGHKHQQRILVHQQAS